ncbi:MAG: PhoX family protein [Actinomycetes bacterium]
MSDLTRRHLLRAGAATALAGPFTGFLARQAAGGSHRPPGAQGLVEVLDERDGVLRLELPPGFRYRSFQASGETLADGTVVPGRHDGMGAFRHRGQHAVLVRNHEVNGSSGAFTGTTPVYDPGAPGGTTSAVVDGEGHVADSWASLAGTQMNCSGGRMPWGSWITCEETVNGNDVFDDFTRGRSAPPTTYVQNARLRKPHGYIFEVPAGGQSAAEPLRSTGRFAHEAVAYSPVDGALYLTEDDFGFASGFYRYVPPGSPSRSTRLEDGGRLYMLAVKDRPRAHLEQSFPAGTRFEVEWVPIPDPDPTFPMVDGLPTVTNDEAIQAVARQGWAEGAAYFSRNEGAVYDRGTVYFTATQGGGPPEAWEAGDGPVGGFGNGRGQVWAYHVAEQVLELVYESPGADVLDFPDNVTTSPRGTVILCEDGGDGNWLRGLSHQGELFDIAQNRIGNGNDEFAGATFGPDGRTLYVNIQSSSGLTFAIWGPWQTIGV